jgi:hypothetical protein
MLPGGDAQDFPHIRESERHTFRSAGGRRNAIRFHLRAGTGGEKGECQSLNAT